MPKAKALIVLSSHGCNVIYGSSQLAEIATRVDLLAEALTPQQLAERPELLADVEVIFSGWGAPKMDEAFLALAPKLRAVFYGAGTIRYFTGDAFWARDITITSAYAMNAIPVSEFTLGVILLSLKNVWRLSLDARINQKHTPRGPMAGGYGSKVGLISLGMIARLVRDRLRPFDLEVLVYDPFLTDSQAIELDVKKVTLDELFAESDVVSLHTPWLKETEGMITGRHFGLMKSGATFLNTARGAIVNEAEMITALQARPEITAFLDVTHPEPPAPDSPLWSLPNVVLTPHIAGSQGRECQRMGRLMIDEFDRWTRGEPLLWQISQEKAALLA